MLLLQGFEEAVSESSLGACALSGYRNGFCRTRRGLVFDKVFEVVIVDVV